VPGASVASVSACERSFRIGSAAHGSARALSVSYSTSEALPETVEHVARRLRPAERGKANAAASEAELTRPVRSAV
jgi:hypothetical protein